MVSEVLPNYVYKVTSLLNEGGRRYSTTVHVSHVKGYHLPEAEAEEGPIIEEEPYIEEKLNTEDVSEAGEVTEQLRRQSGRQPRPTQKLQDYIC